jgi:hypothetical protein
MVKWDKGGTESVGDYTFLYGKGTENHVFGREIFVHKRITSTVPMLEMSYSYIKLGGCWCDIIVLNVHAPTEDKSEDT